MRLSLTLALVLVIGGSGLAATLDNSHQEAPGEERATDQNETAPVAPTVDPSVTPDVEHDDTDRNPTEIIYPEKDLGQQRRMANATEDQAGLMWWQNWLLVGEIVALTLTVVFTGLAAKAAAKAAKATEGQAGASRRAARAASRNAQAAEKSFNLYKMNARRELRAYVGVRLISASYWDNPPRLVTSVVVANRGQTPAKDVQIAQGICIADMFDRGLFDRLVFESSSPLLPNADFRSKGSTEDNTTITPEMVEAARTKKSHLWIYGRIKYVDVFDDPQHCDFLWVAQVRDGRIRMLAESWGNNTSWQ